MSQVKSKNMLSETQINDLQDFKSDRGLTTNVGFLIWLKNVTSDILNFDTDEIVGWVSSTTRLTAGMTIKNPFDWDGGELEIVEIKTVVVKDQPVTLFGVM